MAVGFLLSSLELNDKGEVAAANASTPRASFPYQHMFANPGRQKTPLSVLSAEGSPLPSGLLARSDRLIARRCYPSPLSQGRNRH